jgi:hypothetical protein
MLAQCLLTELRALVGLVSVSVKALVVVEESELWEGSVMVSVSVVTREVLTMYLAEEVMMAVRYYRDCVLLLLLMVLLSVTWYGVVTKQLKLMAVLTLIILVVLGTMRPKKSYD